MGQKRRLEYGIDLVAVDTFAPLLQHLLFDQRQGAAALPLGSSFQGQQGLIGTRLPVAVVVLGKGLAVGAMELVEVLDEAEPNVLLRLDQLVLPDEKPPLLDVASLHRAVIAVVSHLRLQIGLPLNTNLSANYLTSTILARLERRTMPTALMGFPSPTVRNASARSAGPRPPAALSERTR